MSQIVLGIRLTATATAGLQYSGNESTTLRRMLYWPTPFAIYPATYVFRVYPTAAKTVAGRLHWTTFFWGNNGAFSWGSGYERSYYGGHPYPFPPQMWEISASANDYPPPSPYNVEVAWGQWYTQVFRAWEPSANVRRHEFYFDWPDTDKLIVHEDASAPVTPPTPCICIGQAPDQNGVGASSGQSWGGYWGYEEFKGIIRGMQFYDALLSLADCTSEIASPGSARTPWYLNLNPTPDDVTDKSGSGHNPSWDGSDRPTLWTP